MRARTTALVIVLFAAAASVAYADLPGGAGQAGQAAGQRPAPTPPFPSTTPAPVNSNTVAQIPSLPRAPSVSQVSGEDTKPSLPSNFNAEGPAVAVMPNLSEVANKARLGMMSQGADTMGLWQTDQNRIMIVHGCRGPEGKCLSQNSAAITVDFYREPQRGYFVMCHVTNFNQTVDVPVAVMNQAQSTVLATRNLVHARKNWLTYAVAPSGDAATWSGIMLVTSPGPNVIYAVDRCEVQPYSFRR